MGEEKVSESRPNRLPKQDNFIEWYNALLDLAEIVDRSYPVKGTYVWLPYGIRIMKNIVAALDGIFKKNGIEEVLFPLFVPLQFAKINDKWFEGFKDEAFYVNDKELILRPTGEPAMYPMFKLWIKRGKMPIRVYETVSSYRNESKTTHSMIRDREIGFWHEIHTVHKTREEAVKESQLHKEIYTFVWKELLNIPPICVAKPRYELFAGADSSFEFYNILPDGKLLENGSINNLGQAYARKFELTYIDEAGNKQYMWQMCTGNGARFLAAVIAVHGDAKGLVLPPRIAPIDIVIIPIIKTETKNKIENEVSNLVARLTDSGIKTYADLSEITAGEKFNLWDLKGVPIRIEVGEKETDGDAYTVFRRDLNKKEKVEKTKLIETLQKLLAEEIPNVLLEKAAKVRDEKIKFAETMDAASDLIQKGSIAKANWCESEECFEKMAALGPSIEAIGTLTEEKKEGKCIVCGKKTNLLTLIGKTY